MHSYRIIPALPLNTQTIVYRLQDGIQTLHALVSSGCFTEEVGRGERPAAGRSQTRPAEIATVGSLQIDGEVVFWCYKPCSWVRNTIKKAADGWVSDKVVDYRGWTEQTAHNVWKTLSHARFPIQQGCCMGSPASESNKYILFFCIF